jgi:LmeA-like phospholipid-binding
LGVIVAAMVSAVLAVLVVADRVAVIYAQHRVARRIGDEGFADKPHVTIAGFPFLTQVAARRFSKIVVSTSGKRRGPAEIKRLDITLSGVRVNSRGRAGTAAQVSGTALVGFAGVAGMAGTPGLAIAADGPDRVKITVGMGRVTGTATARVSRAGPGGIRIAVLSAGGIPVAALGSLRDMTVPLPVLPLRMTIQGVSVTGEGVLVHIAGQNVSFGG